MTKDDERKRGLEILEEILASGRVLHVNEPRTFHNGNAYYFEVTAYGHVADFSLPAEVLEDLPGMPTYREQAKNFARALEKRLRNPNPRGFMTMSGVALDVELIWPAGALPGKAASYVQANVRHLGFSTLAKCYVVVTYEQQTFELKEFPFTKFPALINSIRDAVDAGTVIFYDNNEQPETLQRVDLQLKQRQRSDSKLVATFLERKVFWLGFKTGNTESLVWIADPWDAEYMGLAPPDLQREAEILQARAIVHLEETHQLAAAGGELLLRAHELETCSDMTANTAAEARDKTDSRWDVFISHASEDKEGFVQPLAEALRKRGVEVWYDKFTLKLGDSLREKIDYGLRYSRFGVVVLSPNFFKKDWPQKELDGLVAMEVGRRKVILPIWHKLTRAEVANYSPILAGRVAVATSEGLNAVVDEIIHAIE